MTYTSVMASVKRKNQPHTGLVRASIFLSAKLHKALRIEAARRNISLSRLAAEELEASLSRQPECANPPKLSYC